MSIDYLHSFAFKRFEFLFDSLLAMKISFENIRVDVFRDSSMGLEKICLRCSAPDIEWPSCNVMLVDDQFYLAANYGDSLVRSFNNFLSLSSMIRLKSAVKSDNKWTWNTHSFSSVQMSNLERWIVSLANGHKLSCRDAQVTERNL